MVNSLSKEQLARLAKKSEETKAAAENVEKTLNDSAALLMEAKESMILAMLKEQIDVETVSIATKTPVDVVENIRLKLQ